MKKLIKKYKELILYGIVGVATTVVNLGSLKVFNMIFGDDKYLFSNILAWFAAVVFSYIANKLFVFESRSWEMRILAKEISTFFSARIFSLLIEEIGLYTLVELLGFEKYTADIFGITVGGIMISKGIIAVFVVIINYVFSKLVIFKKKK